MEINKIYNKDCLEGMRLLPDDSIDVIITSPPYNLGNNHHTGGKRFKAYEDDMPETDYQKWQVEVLDECFRLLKPDGSLFYNHKNRIRNKEQITPYEWLLKTKLIIKQELVWFNRSQNFDKVRFYPMTERVYWLSKNKETRFRNNINHHDLFDWKPTGTNKAHKRAFPEKMVMDILSCFHTGILVLDPFSGSGTVAKVCLEIGDNYIGFEKSEDYWKLSTSRVEEDRPLSLRP